MKSNEEILEYYQKDVVKRFAKEQNESLETGKAVWREMLKFLYVASQTDDPCSPSPIVDKMWHTFIIYTKPYKVFCEGYLGKFIHHFPKKASDSTATMYQNTLKRIEKEFGELPKDIWSEKQHGSSAESCCHNDCGSDPCCHNDCVT